MRVAFDARHAARGLGISTFLTALAGELAAMPGVELVWLGEPLLAPPCATSSVALRRAPYPLLDGPLGRARIARLKCDVVHFTGNTAWGRPGPVASVLTLHDLIFMTSSARHRNARQLIGHRYERWLIERALRAVDVVAVPSETVAQQVRHRFGEDVEPRVVLEGVLPAPTAKDTAATADDDPAPAEPYLLAFAGRDPRKRSTDVVDAWRSFAPATLRLRLLASGGLPDELRSELAGPVADGHVEILDHLPRERLWQVLAGAVALAYPTIDEGFGLPVLEAMAAGTPVLSGLAPATREVGGDAIVKLDPQDIPGSIAAAVRRLQAEPAWREEHVRRGLERAAQFSWRRTAEGYRALYEEAISRHRSRATQPRRGRR